MKKPAGVRRAWTEAPGSALVIADRCSVLGGAGTDPVGLAGVVPASLLVGVDAGGAGTGAFDALAHELIPGERSRGEFSYGWP